MNESQIFIKELISFWCNDEGHYGLTLTNIIGGIRTNTTNVEYNISDFFEGVLNSKIELKISFCSDLDELVFGTFKNEDAPKNYYKNIETIYYSENDFDPKISSYNDFVLFFNKKYLDKIENGLYSKDYETKEWSGITEDDKKLFSKICK